MNLITLRIEDNAYTVILPIAPDTYDRIHKRIEATLDHSWGAYCLADEPKDILFRLVHTTFGDTLMETDGFGTTLELLLNLNDYPGPGLVMRGFISPEGEDALDGTAVYDRLSLIDHLKIANTMRFALEEV